LASIIDRYVLLNGPGARSDSADDAPVEHDGYAAAEDDNFARLNSAVGVRGCVLADLGLAVASEWMFAPELEAKTVKPVLTDWLLPPVEAWAIFPTGRQVSAKARAFASFIESHMLNRDRFQQQMGAEN
jgi:DNA-binding transcriptional LysR family regulator